MWRSILALSLIAILSPAIPSAAEQPDAAPPAVPAFKFEAALNKIDQKVTTLLGADKQKTLRQIAEAAVLSDYCAAINLNQNKFKEEFAALAADGRKRPPAEQRDFDNKLMTYFGVYVGLLVAEGTDRKAAFCEVAQNAMKNQKPISRFWVATTGHPALPKQ
jgi:hypothetical protein